MHRLPWTIALLTLAAGCSRAGTTTSGTSHRGGPMDASEIQSGALPSDAVASDITTLDARGLDTSRSDLGAPDLADGAADGRTDVSPPAQGPCLAPPLPPIGWHRLPTRSPQRSHFTLDPVDPNVAYAISDGRWLMSTVDGGRTWCYVETPGEAAGVWVAPSATHVLYLLAWPTAQQRAFYRSDDRGRSWQRLPSDPLITFSRGSDHRRALTIHPRDPNVAYAPVVYAPGGIGAGNTVDGGRTWSNLGNRELVRAVGFIVDPRNPDHVYGWQPAHGLDYTLVRSLDGGLTWPPIPSPIFSELDVVPPATLDNDSRLLVRDRDGFMRQSKDQGSTWTRPTTFGHGLPFVFPGSARDTLYTVDLQSRPRIIKTTNGEDWVLASEMNGPTRVLGAGKPEGSFFFEVEAGVVRTLDEGRNWYVMAPDPRPILFAVSPAPPYPLYVARSRAVFRSTDRGQTFNGAITGANHLFWILRGFAADASDPHTVYASWQTDIGVEAYISVKSTDGGQTWTPWSVRLPEETTQKRWTALASSPARPATMYAAVDKELRKTIDAGRTWSTVLDRGGEVTALVVAPSDSEVVFANLGSVSRWMWTADGGKTWADLALGSAGEGRGWVEAVAIHPSDARTVYAGGSTSFGVAKSADGGKTWTSLKGGFSSFVPSVVSLSVARTSPATVYAGGNIGDVHRSLDGGVTWTRVDGKQIPSTRIVVVSDPSDARTVYSWLLPDLYTRNPEGLLYRTTTGGD